MLCDVFTGDERQKGWSVSLTVRVKPRDLAMEFTVSSAHVLGYSLEMYRIELQTDTHATLLKTSALRSITLVKLGFPG